MEKVTNGTTVKGSIKGCERVNYKLGAREGQSLCVSLESKKAFSNFYEPGKGAGDEAMFIGSVTGASYVGTLPDREYAIGMEPTMICQIYC